MHAHVQRQLSSSEGERLNRDRERERGAILAHVHQR